MSAIALGVEWVAVVDGIEARLQHGGGGQAFGAMRCPDTHGRLFGLYPVPAPLKGCDSRGGHEP